MTRIIDLQTGMKSSETRGYSIAPVKIGGCWICTNTVILKGVTIGEHSVIGAGCVVSQDIPAYSIVRNRMDLMVEELRK